MTFDKAGTPIPHPSDAQHEIANEMATLRSCITTERYHSQREIERLTAENCLLGLGLIECFDVTIPQAMPWTGSHGEKAVYAAKALPHQLRGLLRLRKADNERLTARIAEWEERFEIQQNKIAELEAERDALSAQCNDLLSNVVKVTDVEMERDAALERESKLREALKLFVEPKCPASGCGVGVDRSKCMFELDPSDCPRHDVRAEWQKQVRLGYRNTARVLKETTK